MVDYNAIGNAIRTRANTEIAAAQSVSVGYDNVSFEPSQGALSVRCTVQFGQSFQVSRGTSARFRTPGIAFFEVFAALGTGDGAALDLVDAINLAFRAVTADGVTYRTPSVGEGTSDGPTWRITVSCPFYSDNIS